MTKTKYLIFIGLLYYSITISAQIEPPVLNRYFVYFTDKSGLEVENYPYSLDSATEFLTQRSIDRRRKQNILLDSTDLPVPPSYVQALQNISGVEVYFTSKWFNGVLIQSQEEQVQEIKQLSFTDSVRMIASWISSKRTVTETQTPTLFEDPIWINTYPSTDFQLNTLGINRLHEKNIKGQGMLIAVLDDGFIGVDRWSPFRDLWHENRIIFTKDFVGRTTDVFQPSPYRGIGSHGTLVLSTIGGFYQSGNNRFIGSAYKASFVLCVTEDGESENIIEEYNWLLGAELADSLGADVINSSLGYVNFDIPSHNYSYEKRDGRTAISSMAANLASNKGMVVVVSAGNGGNKENLEDRYISAPADAIGALAVGSVSDIRFLKSSFSSIGPTFDDRTKPDIMALGQNTTVVNAAGTITQSSGTSFSAPLITGLIANLLQAHPTWTSDSVKQVIKNISHNRNNINNQIGYGVPDYAVFINEEPYYLTTLNVEPDDFTNKIIVFSNPVTNKTIYLKTNYPIVKDLSIKLIDDLGREIFRKEKINSETIYLTVDEELSGLYFLILQTGDDIKTLRMMIN